MKTFFLAICICSFAITVYGQHNLHVNYKGSIFGKVNSPLAGIPKDYYKSSYDSLQKQIPSERQIPLERLFRKRDNSSGGYSFRELPLARKGDYAFKLLPLAKEGDYEFKLIPRSYSEVYRVAEKKN